MIFLTTLLLAIIPQTEPITDSVSVIELNKFYNEQAHLVFEQLIFWEWDERIADHTIVAWRMYKSRDQIPRKNFRTMEYEVTWYDQQDFCWRRVVAKSYRVSRTFVDGELVERAKWPVDKRRGLTGVSRRVKLEESILR